MGLKEATLSALASQDGATWPQEGGKENKTSSMNGERSSGNAVNNSLLIFFFVCMRQRHFGRHVSPDGSAKVTVHAETSPIFYYRYIRKPADAKPSAHHACFETD